MDVIAITFESPETCDCLQSSYDNILNKLGDLNYVGSFSNRYIYTSCNHITNILEDPDAVSTDYINTQIKALELYLLHYLGRSDDGLQSKRKQFSYQVSYSMQRLSLSVASKIHIEDVAREIKVSHAYLSKLFRQEVGITPHQFLLLNRIKKAKLLLTDTVVDIATIADECGFSHQSHLTRNFTKEVGISPLRFRQYAKRRLDIS
jgi:AraC family transcriptional regulator